MKKVGLLTLAVALVLLLIAVAGCGSGNVTAISGYQVPTTFVFTIQPGGAVPGEAFTTQPVVSVTDDYGNVISGWSTPITLSITAGTGATGAVLSGTATISPNNGVATFTNLSIDLAGPVYCLTATSGNLRPANSDVFAVAAAPPPTTPAATAPTTVTVTVTQTETTT